MKACACLIALLVCVATPTLAQNCPLEKKAGSDALSGARTLEGVVIYHNGIRQWYELKLDKPFCNQKSIELLVFPNVRNTTETLRGCRVRSYGLIGDAVTGYYSLDVNQAITTIEPIGDCKRQLPLPPEPTAKPDKSIRSYRVDMHVDYSPGDHPVEFRATGAGKKLMPWQAYAHYFLTGGFVLYGYCGEGFVTDKVWGTPEASPQHLEEPRTESDAALYDPESAAAAGKTDLHLSYTCVRLKK